MMRKILLIGSAGSVAHDMMYLTSCMTDKIRIVCADFNEVKGRYEVDECLHVAHNLGLYPDFSFRKIDLMDIKNTSELLKEEQPTVICNLSSLGAWWVTRLLPAEVYQKIGPIGPWIPFHFALTHKLMQAVKRSGVETQVINGAFPDLTNVILGKLDLAPTCGGGNMDLGASRLRKIVANELKVPVREVQVLAVGHHGTFYTAKMDGPAWYKIIAAGEDVSDRFPIKTVAKLYADYGYANMPSFPGPLVDQMKTASSFLKEVFAIYYNTGELMQSVPAPQGLPGSYPAILDARGAHVKLSGISLEDAVKINEQGARIDGIEQVKPDGTVVYMEKNVKLMREIVGYECAELKPSEHEERAKELDAKLKNLYEKYKVGTRE
jgi:hypothetical protein